MTIPQQLIQNAYVVNDIDAAIERWHALWGIGPFFVRRHIAMPHDGGVHVGRSHTGALSDGGRSRGTLGSSATDHRAGADMSRTHPAGPAG